MAFSAYKEQNDFEALGFTVRWKRLTPNELLPSVTPSETLKIALDRGALFSKVSEKAKSEMLISPLLLEVVANNIENFSILSGVNLEVKKGENGKSLKGAVDFLLCLGKDLLGLKCPLVAVVESKKDDLTQGYWQCAAEMVAAQQFNLEKGKQFDTIWGCVSTGFEWQFLNLVENQLTLEKNIYTLNDLPMLLGAWQWILDQCK